LNADLIVLYLKKMMAHENTEKNTSRSRMNLTMISASAMILKMLIFMIIR